MTIPMKFQSAFSKYEAAKMTVAAFKQEHRAIIEEYEMLIRHFEEAETAVKVLYKENHEQIGPKYGDFKVIQPTVVDVDKLLQLCPAAEPWVHVKKSLLKEDFEKLQRDGTISAEVASEVEVRGSVQIRNR